jgi:hypothetical protein
VIEIAVIKRPALHKGEIGLFATNEWDSNSLASLGNETAWAEVSTPHSLQLLRYLWAIAQKLADGGLYEDKDEAMDDLKIRARFARWGVIKDTPIVVPRSLSRASYDTLHRLADRFVHIVCSDLLPDMPESAFRKALEEMIK